MWKGKQAWVYIKRTTLFNILFYYCKPKIIIIGLMFVFYIRLLCKFTFVHHTCFTHTYRFIWLKSDVNFCLWSCFNNNSINSSKLWKPKCFKQSGTYFYNLGNVSQIFSATNQPYIKITCIYFFCISLNEIENIFFTFA